MTSGLAQYGLAIESRVVSPDAINFRPPTWPPGRDFPIVVDDQGIVISRYGDPVWDLRPWAKKAAILNFGDGEPRKRTPCLSPVNADLLRQVSAWWLYGPSAVRSAITLRQRFYDLRKLFFLCSSNGIAASDLMKFPVVADQLPLSLAPSQAESVLALLHVLYEQRNELGFTLLDREGLRRLESALPNHEPRQTPYIPPRIWAYQITQLRAFLDDFHAHRDKIEACYHFCLDAYAHNCGSLAEACRVGRNKELGPFWCYQRSSELCADVKNYGPFVQTAQRFGIHGLLQKWVVRPEGSFDVRSLAVYFSMVGYAGMAYLLNFSLMRIEEGWSLRANCLEIEQDPHFGALYLLRGKTTKTVDDEDARWPTSPSVKVAVDAMKCVARLRMICAQANPDVPTTAKDIENPYLVLRAYEPWGSGVASEFLQPLSVRPGYLTYLQVFDEAFPNLFDMEQLQVKQEDLQIARLVTPTLDAEKFVQGLVWPLAWHQLRRTGAVNMQASGLVSDASLQYLLKHASRTMSLYYGQGYSRVPLNSKAQNTYIRTMYEVMGHEIERLFTDRFVSPHGVKRKEEILRIVGAKEGRKLAELARLGKIAWRETLLGGCTKRGPCTYGGVDNIAHCGGGDGGGPCADVLYDRDKKSELHQLRHEIDTRLLDAPSDSPYQRSLLAQKQALENALSVIESS